jgi:4-hydroxy-tetrahydrodipicolinate reductase|tara:strand:+ start:245 stop:898 length:654 start_codon:yes stop_codon:yes gene_type:complete
MIKVTINGASGKMGTKVSNLIKNDSSLIECFDDISCSDLVIDFSQPSSTKKILKKCVAAKKPIIIGTTGFTNDDLNEIREAANSIPIVLAANMSKGIFYLKKSLASFINNNQEKLRCLIEETHHLEKIDKPSGTAIELKKFIIEHDNNNFIQDLKIKSNRVADIFGTHKIMFCSDNGTVCFSHEALSRGIFAEGAITCAKSIGFNKPNLYSFEDIIN